MAGRPATDLVGSVFGRLTVRSREQNSGGRHARWRCQCMCGNETVAWGYSLRAGRTKSCGCMGAENAKAANTIHAASATRAYRIRSGMLQRCYNPKHIHFDRYGGRGITVCARWRESSAAFIEDMGQPPSGLHTIERRDVDGPYSPDNCYWATQKDQQRNRTNNRIVIVAGERLVLATAAERYGVPYSKVKRRLRAGWPVERALNIETSQ